MVNYRKLLPRTKKRGVFYLSLKISSLNRLYPQVTVTPAVNPAPATPSGYSLNHIPKSSDHLHPQTCAHLYELRQRVNQPSETRDPIGRCYVLSEDLTERDDLDGGEWKFCEGRPQGHEQFGFCQQGLAASFTPDSNFILFGAPGTYNWKGKRRELSWNSIWKSTRHGPDQTRRYMEYAIY